MKENSSITIKDLSKDFNLTEKTIFRAIQKLKELSKVERIGSDKIWLIGMNCLFTWQQKTGIKGLFSIDDDDRNGFMNALSGVDKTKGLDLILHTPGGDTTATQSIVKFI